MQLKIAVEPGTHQFRVVAVSGGEIEAMEIAGRSRWGREWELRRTLRVRGYEVTPDRRVVKKGAE